MCCLANYVIQDLNHMNKSAGNKIFFAWWRPQNLSKNIPNIKIIWPSFYLFFVLSILLSSLI